MRKARVFIIFVVGKGITIINPQYKNGIYIDEHIFLNR